MRKLTTGCLLLASLVVISACSKPKKEPQDYSVIPAFEQSAETHEINKIRFTALRDTAISVGAQGALAWRGDKINHTLKREKRSLDQVFNFRALLLKENVLPPVLAEGDHSLNMGNPEALRLADKVYRIESHPRFVTAPPLWEDYLWMKFEKPEKPDNSLLPRDKQEREIWNKYVQVGWEQGLEQANEIFNANLARLKRDYEGMLLYRKLLAQNMVSQPFVARADLGITGDENELRINDRVLRITATSELNTNSNEWLPALTQTKGMIKSK